MPTIHIPSPLRSYTNGAPTVSADGTSIEAVLADLDRLYPGIRFRMIDEQGRVRQHIRIFVNTSGVHDLATQVGPTDVVHLICALSGG